MKRIFVLIILAGTFSLQAAAPRRGDDRLRELAVFPEMKLNFEFGMELQGDRWVMYENVNLPDEIVRLREELKRRPEDTEQLLRLGDLLDSNGETNEARICYQKAEQLCRNKIAAKPQDGLYLTELGEALSALGKEEEAEHVYRKATLVSSNDWRCWISLGNFLANEPFLYLFPSNFRNQIYSETIPQEVLNYRPPPGALKKAESSVAEASHCFDRAVALAPKEPEVFFQRAGYLSNSNSQSCFFRHFHNNDKLDSRTLLLAFYSQTATADLLRAAELNPKDYQYASLAAYFQFQYINSMAHANNAKPPAEILSGKDRQFAMTRLENLSQDADKKTAAAASENLGILNMAFGNKQQAAANFRRAVSLDPSREQSWDMLLGTLKNSASPDELVALCESRLKYKNSAKNHLLLAKLYAKQKEWTLATQQAETADQLETNNIISSLLIAAVALKENQTNSLSVAKVSLTRVCSILQAMPMGDERTTRWREYMLNVSIGSALDGQTQAARDGINEVLKYFPADETAKEILKNLEAN